MIIAKGSAGDHATCGHASDSELSHVEDLKVGNGLEDGGDFIDALGEVMDGLGGGVAVFSESFAVPWEVDGDGSDSGADPTVISSWVEFFVDCSTVDPEDPRAGGLGWLIKVGMDDEGWDIVTESHVL